MPIRGEEPPTSNAAAPVFLGLLVIGMAAVGVWCVITVNSTEPSDTRPVTLSLLKSNDHSTWEVVCTKTVTLNGTNAVEFFREEMVDQTAFYKVKKAQ
jgi:hypothetical protein